MTSPSMKAIQLIDKYCIIIEGKESINIDEPWSKSTWNKAKQCALAALEEIREFPIKLSNFEMAKYWFEVKQEINKL